MNMNREADPSSEEAGKVYCIRVERGNGQMDPQLAAAMQEIHEARLRDPNSWENNPDKHREALEGLGRLLAEWQEENGAFTEEELARARASMYGP